MTPGPSRNVHWRIATSASPVTPSACACAPVAPAKCCCRVTTDRMATTPTRMSAASTTREVTKPIAALRLTRLVTGYSSDGGGDAGGGRQELQHRSPLQGRVAARVADVPGRVGDDVGEQLQLRDRGGERDEVGDAAGEGDLPRGLHPPAGGGVAWRGCRGLRWWSWRAPWRPARSSDLERGRAGSGGSVGQRGSAEGSAERSAEGSAEGSSAAGVTETSGNPMSLSLRSTPCNPAWSVTAGENGAAVARAGEGMPSNQAGPAVVQVTLDSDLVPAGVVARMVRHAAHLPSAVRPGSGTSRKVGSDVVSRRPHMW